MAKKLLRKGIFVFIVFSLVVGTCGCMNKQEQKKKIAELTGFVSKKYNKNFKFEYFKPARDYTYTNILTLSYEDYVFNVYQKGDNVDNIADNFPVVIINKRITDYLIKKNGLYLSDIGLRAYYLFSENNSFSYEYASEESVENIIKDNSLIKVIVLLNTDNEMAGKKDELYDAYKIFKGLNSKYIDFEVIQTKEITAEIDRVLNNITGYYDNDWSKYKGIKAYIDVTEKDDIVSADELVSEVN